MTGECNACGESFRLYPDGRLKNHGPLGRPCDGSGELAVGVEPPRDLNGLEYLLDLDTDREWVASANCRDLPVNVFFPVSAHEVPAAKAVCARCAVRDDCLEYALKVPSGQDAGIFGGTDERERRRLRRQRAAA